MGKYGKNKDLFIQGKNECETDLVDEQAEPEIESLGLETFVKNQKALTPMESMKKRILDHLKLYFSNIKMDYLVRQFGCDENLKFEFITDFCDPILKIVIQFPETFWHNMESALDPNKNYKLGQYGWKIIEIPTNNPSFELINKYIDEV